MPHQSLARVIAPLALAASAAAVVLVIASSDAISGGSDGAATRTTTASRPAKTPASAGTPTVAGP